MKTKAELKINPSLMNELKIASDECWDAKMAAQELAKKHASICVKIVEALGYPPLLNNQVMQKRAKATDGLAPKDEDFWANPEMIMRLFEYMSEEFFWRDDASS